MPDRARLKSAVFLDRDGTLIDEVAGGYLLRLDQLAVYPWSAAAVRLLNEAGFTVVVATNQSAVARGYITEVFLDSAHRALNDQLATGGAHIDAFYCCPHYPEGAVAEYSRECGCRKPAPGMLLRAAEEHHLDLSRSWMIGDAWRDVRCGHAAGARTVLVTTGHGGEAALAPPGDVTPDAILSNLMEAVTWILRMPSSR